jgi:hypothetical protein
VSREIFEHDLRDIAVGPIELRVVEY